MILTLLSSLLVGTVVMRADARIAGPSVELGEIAEIRGVDAALLQRLTELPIGPSPAAGHVRGVRREDIAAALRSAAIDIDVFGAPLCRARTEVEVLGAREIEESARRAVGTLFAGRDVEVELDRPITDVAIPVPERRRELKVDLGRREAQPGSWNVPVDVYVDAVRVQTTWVVLDVTLYEEMPIAARDLRRGEAIDASCWKFERKRIEAAGPRPAAASALLGATSTRDMTAGTPITEVDVRREPLVRPGDFVELEVVRGPIRARSRAVARTQGALGDRVEIQCGDGRRRLVGIVIQRGLVRVELAESRGLDR